MRTRLRALLLLALASSSLGFSAPLQHRITHRSAPLSPQSLRTLVVTAEAHRAQVPVPLALAVSRLEDPLADTAARGRLGEVGYFQIRARYWNTIFPECYPALALTHPARNACIGVRVLRRYFRQYGNWNLALRAYNGALRLPHRGDRYVTGVMSRLYQGE